MAFTTDDFKQPSHLNTWCPGCGNFGILASLQKALVEGGYDPKDTVLVSGIGCSSKIPHYVKTYAFETLHGRALPVASGVKLANPSLNVVACGGDGDGYGIGSAHFLHTARRNIDMLYIVHNNQIYALTKGQYSPKTEKGHITPTSPHGVIEMQLNALAVAIVAGATFVARGYANDISKLVDLFKQGMAHKGFAIVEVLQPCVTWRKDHPHAWFKEHTTEYKTKKVSDKAAAVKFLLEEAQTADKFALGIFYKEDKLTYEDELKLSDKTPVVKQQIDNVDISKLLAKYE